TGMRSWAEKTGADRYAFRLYGTKRCALDRGGRIVDDCGHWYAVMGGENRSGSLRFSFVWYKAVCAGSWGED
ncbi:hypothetical protein VS883_28730, partial [Escherichia coli]